MISNELFSHVDDLCVNRYGDLPRDLAKAIAPLMLALDKIKIHSFFKDIGDIAAITDALRKQLEISGDDVVREYGRVLASVPELIEKSIETATKSPHFFRICVNEYLYTFSFSNSVQEVAKRLRLFFINGT
ncbi:MAG: hypothetical protein QXT27_01770 [Pyrobaculum sp.]